MRVAYLQLGLTVVLFGLTWPVIKIGLSATTPVWLAAGRASLSAISAFVLLAVLRRLQWPERADWPIVLSVGAFQLSFFFALSNLGVQSVPPGRSGVLAYTTMLWMAPLSLLVGERVGGRGIAGALLGLLGIVVLIDPWRFDWSDRRIVEGHAWLLLAGLSWAVAVLHARRHRWRLTPLEVLPWQMSVATILLLILALVLEPGGHFDFSQANLWIALAYLGVIAGPTGTWAAVSVARALPPVTASLGMLGTPLLGIASSVVLVGEPVTWPLVLGTMLVIAGIAIVILGRARMNWGMMTKAERDAAYNNSDAVKNSAELNAARIAASEAFRKAHPEHLDLRYGPKERNVWDLFPAKDANAPCLVFIHGGYWQRNSRDQFASLIAGVYAHGWAAALPGYTLAPDASLTEIVAEINAALDWLAANGPAHGINGKVVLSGWSAGGHLTAQCLGHKRVSAGLAVSGVFELGPIRDTYLNEKMQFTDTELATLSPLRLPMINKPLAITYGTAELPPLVADSRALHEKRAAQHLPGPLIPVAGADHFTITHELRDADGLLTRQLLLLA